MKILRNLPVTPLAIACLLLAGTAAKAGTLAINLLAPFQSGPGNVFAFDATVTNTSGSTVFLSADAFNVDSPLMVGQPVLPDPDFPGALEFLHRLAIQRGCTSRNAGWCLHRIVRDPG